MRRKYKIKNSHGKEIGTIEISSTDNRYYVATQLLGSASKDINIHYHAALALADKREQLLLYALTL